MFLFSLNLMYKHNFIIVVYLFNNLYYIWCINLHDQCLLCFYAPKGSWFNKNLNLKLVTSLYVKHQVRTVCKKNTWSFRFFVLLGTCGWEKTNIDFNQQNLSFKKIQSKVIILKIIMIEKNQFLIFDGIWFGMPS